MRCTGFEWDANAVQSVLIGGGIGLVTPVVTVIGMVLVTAWIDWRLALVALIVCPILYAAARRFRARIVTRWHQVRTSRAWRWRWSRMSCRRFASSRRSAGRRMNVIDSSAIRTNASRGT